MTTDPAPTPPEPTEPEPDPSPEPSDEVKAARGGGVPRNIERAVVKPPETR